MDQHRFFNACMLLMNIDKHELVEAGIIKEGQTSGTCWMRFNDEPLVFLAKIDDKKRDALWKLLEGRQPIPAPRVRYAFAPSHPADRASLPKALYNLGDVRLAWVNEGDLCMIGQEVTGEPLAPPKTPLARALELLGENLIAWEGEEDSVKEEHADLIAELSAFMEERR